MTGPQPLGPVGEKALEARNLDRRHPFRHASDAALVAALTGTSLVDSAALIERYGSLHRLARATAAELEEAGIPSEGAQRLTAGVALGLRVAQQRFEPGQAIHKPEDVIERFRPQMMLEDRESMVALLLNVRKQVIGEMEIALGGLNSVNMTPREVFTQAMRENADCLILVHNHPAGDPSPSQADIDFAQRMSNVGKALQVEVLDSIVVARKGGVSLRLHYPYLFDQEKSGYNMLQAVADAGRPLPELTAGP